MIVGVPKEQKTLEFRVGITPAGVRELSTEGHTVLIESSAGVGSHFSDDHYRSAGAIIVETANEIWERATLIVKVKEPLPDEYPLIREETLLFTYLHLAPDPELTGALVDSGSTSIAYETVRDSAGKLPLLQPMSEVAGRLSVFCATNCLTTLSGTLGILPGGVPGVLPSSFVIIGAGTAGLEAASTAAAIGAQVTVLDVDLDRLRHIDEAYHGTIRTVMSNQDAITDVIPSADVVIGSALMPGAKSPKLVTNHHVKTAKPGSVFVDIAIDQGGCFEDSRATTHQDPTFLVYKSIFYCVANMPGIVPRTSTLALTNATMPYVRRLAEDWRGALENDPGLAQGLSTYQGKVTDPEVIQAQKLTAS